MKKGMKKNLMMGLIALITLMTPFTQSVSATQAKITQSQPMYQKAVPPIGRTMPPLHNAHYYYRVDSFGRVKYYDPYKCRCCKIGHYYPSYSSYTRLPDGETFGINVTYTLNRSSKVVKVGR